MIKNQQKPEQQKPIMFLTKAAILLCANDCNRPHGSELHRIPREHEIERDGLMQVQLKAAENAFLIGVDAGFQEDSDFGVSVHCFGFRQRAHDTRKDSAAQRSASHTS